MNTDLLQNTLDLPLQLDKSAANRLKDFIRTLFQQEETSYAVFSFPVSAPDPLPTLRKRWNNDTFHYYWEKPAENFAIAAGGELASITASGNQRFMDINRQHQAVTEATASFSTTTHAYAGLMFLGGFSFSDTIQSPNWEAFKPGALTVPRWLIIKDDKYALTTLAYSLDNFTNATDLYQAILDQLVELEQHLKAPSIDTTDKDFSEITHDFPVTHPLNNGHRSWLASVQKARQYIREDRFQKIVLARQLSLPNSAHLHPTEMLHRLRNQYPNCSCFLIHPPRGESFLGATPEHLASFQQNLLLTEALAGSIQRGTTAAEDLRLEQNLAVSTKNRQEHQFVVRDIAQRLDPFAQSIHWHPRPRIKKLSNVQHLYTPVRAELTSDADILSIVGRLHPTPAVGGYPREKAEPYIRRLETFERGWYAGPVGWLNATGSGEFAVAIRSGLIGKQQAQFFAGCGIVADSDPQAEWEETNLKLAPMLTALQYD